MEGFSITGVKVQQATRIEKQTNTQKNTLIKESLNKQQQTKQQQQQQRQSQIPINSKNKFISASPSHKLNMYSTGSYGNMCVSSKQLVKKPQQKRNSANIPMKKTPQQLEKLENGFKLPPIQSSLSQSGNKENMQQRQISVKPQKIMSATLQKQKEKRNTYDFLSRTGIQHDQEIEHNKINTFFKVRIASLLHALNQKTYFLSFLEDSNANKQKKPPVQNIQEQLHRLKKIVATKSKYRYREKCEFQKSLILQSVNVNVQSIKEKMQEDKMILDQMYEDLDDDHDETVEKEKTGTLIKKQIFFTNDGLVHYKKKKGLLQNQKVFIIVGGYQSLRKTLLGFGWVENPEKDSLYYDLKWTCKSKDIDYNNTLDCQFLNHYVGNGCMSSKQGIAKNLKNLIWYENMDYHNFYPRCYDLNDQQEFEDFIEEFKFTKALSILRKFNQQQREPNNATELTIIQICIASMNKKSKHFLQKVNEINQGILPIITPREWKLIEKWPDQSQVSEKRINYLQDRMKDNVNLERIDDIQEYVQEILEQQEKNNPQYHMEGDNNNWVVKPAGLSRGRGIRSFNNLQPIMDYVFCKDIQWVAQKYLEKLHLIDNKKYDIRQWVIVTDFNPVTIFYYGEFYIRLCSEKYNVNDLNNKFSHLVNNQIQKEQINYEENKDETMLSQEEFKNYLKENENEEAYKIIRKKMLDAITKSIKSVAESVTYRKNTFEFLGYDFMIDTKFNPWLIEINTSPSMEYSTSVTKKLVQEGLQDTGKMINNYICNGRRIGRDTDIGKWKFLYRENKDK